MRRDCNYCIYNSKAEIDVLGNEVKEPIDVCVCLPITRGDYEVAQIVEPEKDCPWFSAYGSYNPARFGSVK